MNRNGAISLGNFAMISHTRYSWTSTVIDVDESSEIWNQVFILAKSYETAYVLSLPILDH